MFCTNCGHDLTGLDKARFCNACGNPSPQAIQDEQVASKSRKPLGAYLPKPSKHARGLLPILKKTLVQYIPKLTKKQLRAAIASAIAIPALVVGGLIAIDTYRIDESDKNVKLSELISSQQISGLKKVVCPKLERAMFNSDEQAIYSKRIKSFQKAISRSDKRYPPIFARKNAWTSETIPDIAKTVRDSASSQLRALLSKNPRVDSKTVASLSFKFSTAFTNNLINECGLRYAYRINSELVSTYNSTQSRFQSAVDDAPWYPAGYSEATWASGTDKIAYKWVDRGYGCNSCYQWDINVISKEGCSSSLYAKVDIEKNGVAIGWTNDSLGSLYAGQVGQMRFKYYGDGYGTLTASIQEFSCN
jgi:hypothetical protein